MVRRLTRTSSQDLKRLILAPSNGKFFRPADGYNEVYPGILLGDAPTALSTLLLKELNVTHVLNAAHGRNGGYCSGYVSTSPSYYTKVGIKFLGIPAMDSPSFYLRSYFTEAANFIDEAVRSGGKVLVHCQCGISRSATLIAAYLMTKKGMTADEAISTMRKRRSIFPNQGFLSQLCDFDYDLKRKGELQVRPSLVRDDEPIFGDTLRATQQLPPFACTPYPVRGPKCSPGGYRLSTPFDEFERRLERSRSEERFVSDYRARSPSPVEAYRSLRASSIGPSDSHYERPSTSPLDVKAYSRISPATRASYNLVSPYSDYAYYVKRYPLYPYYQPYKVTPESSRALLSLAEDTKRELTLRERSTAPSRFSDLYSSRTSSSYKPSYSSTTPSYESYNYSPYKYRSFSRYNTSASMPSVLKYPSLFTPSLYSRILKA